MKNQQNTNEIHNDLKQLYNRLLVRDPDKEGLNFYSSLILEHNHSIQDIEKKIKASEEYINIKKFTHNTRQFWNNLPEVAKYIHELNTGDPNINGYESIKIKLRDRIPFEIILMPGCGNTGHERILYDKGIAKSIDAFDVNPEYIKEAEKKKGKRNIRYFQLDINNIDQIKNQYDAIFCLSILHHTSNLEKVLPILNRLLKSQGIIYIGEYVGPSRNQYSDEHILQMKKILLQLPPRLRTPHALKPPLANFRIEPSEAICSDKIVELSEKTFNIFDKKKLNGGIAYQILWDNIEKFKDPKDLEAKNYLKLLIKEDKKLTEKGLVPFLFWIAIGTKKE